MATEEQPLPDPKVKLREQIQSQEPEIAELRRLLEVLVNGAGHSARDSKILELFKKNRELNLVCEREKNTTSKLKLQVKGLQLEVVKRKKVLEKRLSSVATEKPPEAADPQDSSGLEAEPAETPEPAQTEQSQPAAPEGQAGVADEATGDSEPASAAKEPEPEPAKEPDLDAQWKEKFDQVSSKLAEAQLVRTCLTMEVAKLRRALQHEVGEHVPIVKVLEEGGDWKGRSQHITLLRDKVRELRMKLQRSDFDEFQRFQIQAFHVARKKEFQKLAIEYLTLRDELACQKKKLDAIFARKQSLESEIRNAKEKVGMLVNKSENDDKLITALRLEVESYRQVTGPIQYGEKVGGPLQLELLHKEHRLADAFSELKKQCFQQELEIQAQTELILYLRSLAAEPFEKEEMAAKERERCFS